MKTELEIKTAIAKTQSSMLRELENLTNQITEEDYGEACETCFTILLNISTLTAAKRILKP